MSKVRRGWVVGASVVILAAGVAAAASPRRAEDLAAARDARHAVASSRPAGEMPAVVAVSEAPRPEPLPMMWEDLFPPQPGSSRSSASSMPCFDQLQGVGGVSPCPAVTQRALK